MKPSFLVAGAALAISGCYLAPMTRTIGAPGPRAQVIRSDGAVFALMLNPAVSDCFTWPAVRALKPGDSAKSLGQPISVVAIEGGLQVWTWGWVWGQTHARLVSLLMHADGTVVALPKDLPHMPPGSADPPPSPWAYAFAEANGVEAVWPIAAK